VPSREKLRWSRRRSSDALPSADREARRRQGVVSLIHGPVPVPRGAVSLALTTSPARVAPRLVDRSAVVAAGYHDDICRAADHTRGERGVAGDWMLSEPF